MTNKKFHPLYLVLFSLILALGMSSTAFAGATIVIANNDAAGVGFNDTTPATPVGGNTGTTLGQQRLIAFQAAADKWGATLDSSVTITIRAQWTALTCTTNSAVLGSAGAIQIHRDFAGVPFASTWYNESLTGKILGADPDPATPEITANFNVNLGKPGCLDGSPFYLGLDNNHGSSIDLVTVLLHEFGHGLGFQSFTNSSTGAFTSGLPSIFDRFLMDLTNGKSWLQMTNAERAASALKSRKLAWNGPQVQADVPSVLSLGMPFVRINSPAVIAGRYDVGTAAYGPSLSAASVTGDLLLANDGTAPVTDGCEPFPANFFNGKIAVIDRGLCSFKAKTLNAQNAGATAVIIVNNVAGSPALDLPDDPAITTPITIPTVFLTQSDGNIIKAQLGGTVNGTVLFDTSVRAGADPFEKMLLYSPDPFAAGSSVSHWDTSAFPNQLMEPNINGDLSHEVTPPEDLTYSQMRDIGWVASLIPSGISKTSGDNQNTVLNQPFSTPLSVTVSPAVAGITVTWTANAGGSGANGGFPSTGSTAISVTNASGVATAPALTANGTTGLFSVNATAPGAGTTTFNLSVDPAPVSGPACVTDTTQADFAGGVLTDLDVTTSPGNVTLSNAPFIDQQNTTLGNQGAGFNTVVWLGQTFTPAVTGQVTRVDLNLFSLNCSAVTMPNITVSIRAASGNLPTGPDLATGTIPGFCNGAGGFFTATFPTPATVTAGTQYAIVWRAASAIPAGTPAPGYFGTVSAATGAVSVQNPYAGGRRTSSSNSGSTWAGAAGNANNDHGFIEFVNAGYKTSGTLVSSLKDSNPPVAGTTQWGTISWNATVPANTTLQFQVAASNNFGGPFNFVGPDGTASTFFTNGASLAQFNGFRYLKYKALFTSTSSTATPTLSDVTICFNNPAAVTLTVAPATGTAGGTVDLSATLTDSASNGISGKTINFTLNGNSVGSAVTNGSGVATLLGASLAGINPGTYPTGVGASFAGDSSYAPASASNVLTVLDNIQITIGDVTVAEGAVGFRQVNFQVNLSNPAGAEGVSVHYSTANNTAVAPADYTAISDTVLNIPSGSTSGTITVQVKGDTTFEGNETFFVNLSSPSGGTLLDTWAVATIADDEPQGADFDGDGLADVSIWAADNFWRVINSSGSSFTPVNWGSASNPTNDIAVPGDYDGDNKTDVAVWRPSEGNFYIIKSSDNASLVLPWGTTNDRPVPADYDGDGKTDLAVWRPSEGNWYIKQSSNSDVVVRNWGDASDKLVAADYDGDGKADIAIWRPSEGNWYIIQSSDGGLLIRSWGASTDLPEAGDYDGDGKADLAVWRPSEGTWHIINSALDTVTVRNWGATGDQPVPADYDGDGKTDIAVYRPSEGNWYIIKSSDNTVQLVQLGVAAGDLPVPGFYSGH